ncbi:MAG: TPM domain-containing protein [Lachnospiraceae bacterium]|nr:TPM domain-containing protein [Lachnospiraceae bacterium]
MSKEIQREAVKQFLRYFRIWFIILGILFVLWAVTGISYLMKEPSVRGNQSASAERVYDHADVLTEQEEEKLRQLIKEAEEKIRCDIVLVTINKQVGSSDYEWEKNMRNLADDFYDQNNYGYDKLHGDGVLLLDNWYEGQGGGWLSTCGRVYEQFSNGDIDDVLQAVYYEVEENPYKAYCAYIEAVSYKMNGEIPFPGIFLLIPVIVMFVFVAVKMKSPVGKDTVAVNEYVAGGRPEFRAQSDQLVNKFVTRRHIPKPSSSGGGGGRGGSHMSSGGVRHGGGGMRR